MVYLNICHPAAGVLPLVLGLPIGGIYIPIMMLYEHGGR